MQSTPSFATRLLAWFDRHGRKDLPWQRRSRGRRLPDAYHVWVSEIMLQQTQVKTVIPYYQRFIGRFPDVVSLADAPSDAVLEHWSGLGYYARARNLHRAARIVRDEHGGVFPRDFETVKALPGIGPSTAGAILALAFDERHAILDGNVKRVLARHETIEGWPGKTGVANALWEIAERHTPDRRAGDYTQAIMDLGAMVCTRTRPACALCPVAEDCNARELGTPERFPGKKPRREKPLKSTTMVLALAGERVYLERRPESGIWGGLWSFPEVSGDVGDWCVNVLDRPAREVESWAPLRHSFTHFDLDISPVLVRVDGASRKVADGDGATWYPLDAEPPGGIAAPVGKLMTTLRGSIHGKNG